MNMLGLPEGFSFFFVFFSLIPLLITGVIIYIIVRRIAQWNYNNNQPVLSVYAKVVSRRTHTSGGGYNPNTNMHTSSHTSYYVTFEVESGDRMEFLVNGFDYGQLVEGDQGTLTFQGTRYKGFQRQ